MKHLLLDFLIPIACLLLAARFAKILDTQDIDLDDIPANFFPVYSTLSMRTANDNQLMAQLPHLCTVSILRKGLRLKYYRSGKLLHLYLFVILIGNSWDIETNPGPDSRSNDSLYLCGLCDVGWEDRGICCDTCNGWYLIDCQGMLTTMYGVYNRTLNKSMSWECVRCGMPNFSTSLFDTSASLDVSNRFETLSTLSEPDSPIPDNIAPPPPKQFLRPSCRNMLNQRQKRRS